jgi:hypothetical protein
VTGNYGQKGKANVGRPVRIYRLKWVLMGTESRMRIILEDDLG